MEAYSVTLASSGREAATLISENNYDVLVTDFELQDGLGTELVKLFRKKKEGAKSFLVSGSAPEDVRLKDAGFD